MEQRSDQRLLTSVSVECLLSCKNFVCHVLLSSLLVGVDLRRAVAMKRNGAQRQDNRLNVC